MSDTTTTPVTPTTTLPQTSTVSAPSTATIDKNYFKSPTETPEQYTARVAAYNAQKNAASGTQSDTQKQQAANGIQQPNPTSVSGTVMNDVPYGNNQRLVTYADGTQDIVNQTTDSSGNVSYTPTGEKVIGPTSNGQPILPDQQDRQALAQAQADYQTQAKQVSDAITNIQNGVTPLTAGEQAQIDGLKAQFQTLIDQQNLQNTGATGLAQVRGYQTGAAQYDPTFQAKTIGSIVSAGAAKVADLQSKEAAAVAQLTQSFHTNDINAIKEAYSIYQDAYKERTDALQKTISDTQAAIKSAQDAKIAADKVQYDTVTKPIQDLATAAAKNGADAATVAKINAAGSVNDAIAAAGTSIQTSTNPDIAQYLFYKQQSEQAGATPQSYEDYQKAQAALATQQAYAKAYATAKGSAAGTAAAMPQEVTPTASGLGGDSKGGGILSQTGLSIAAFSYLTQGTASMSRMSAAQRSQIMSEAQSYLNRTGTDVATFQTQYKAYNDVLQKNIMRANQTKIMAGEVSGSADALVNAIIANGTNVNDPLASVHGNQSMSSLKAKNILDLMAGNQVNNPFAQTYKTQITFMANDLAGYLAAARGASSPELQDQRDAAQVIANGMNTGSITAFRNAINANEEKVANVVNGAVTETQKQVWGLFGVADKYASPVSTSDVLTQQSQQAAQKVNDYVQKNPGQLDAVTKLYNSNFTDEQVAEYLNL